MLKCVSSFLTVYGAEYAFGAHDFPTSGVFEVEPRQCPGFKFRKAIFMGTTSLEPSEVREFMEQQSRNYYGDTYHLIVKNCNHFCDDISYKLTGKRIPKWVNRLARIGMKILSLKFHFLQFLDHKYTKYDPAYLYSVVKFNKNSHGSVWRIARMEMGILTKAIKSKNFYTLEKWMFCIS